jgi:hypothetical protein
MSTQPPTFARTITMATKVFEERIRQLHGNQRAIAKLAKCYDRVVRVRRCADKRVRLADCVRFSHGTPEV